MNVTEVTQLLANDGYLQENNVKVEKRGNQMVCSVLTEKGQWADLIKEKALVLANEVSERVGIDAIPTWRSNEDGHLEGFAEAIVLTHPITSEDRKVHGFLTQSKRNKLQLVHSMCAVQIVVSGTTILGIEPEDSGLHLDRTIDALIDAYFAGISDAVLMDARSIHDLESSRRLALLGKKTPPLYDGTTHTVRQLLDHNNYRNQKGVKVTKRGGAIVARIGCGWDERAAIERTSTFSNAIYNLVHYKNVPHVYKKDGKFWAEALLLVEPLSPENCRKHGGEYHDEVQEFDDGIWTYFSLVDKKRVVMIGEIEVGRVSKKVPAQRISGFVQWYENGMRYGMSEQVSNG